MDKSLDQYLKDNTKFLKLKNNESVDVIYKGYKIVPDRFSDEDGAEIVSYKLQYPGSEKLMSWQNKSSKVAADMKAIKEGEFIRLTRTGEGAQTKYSIVSLSKDMSKATVLPDR